MASRIPPLLEPYLHHLPHETSSLILLSGVLGSSTNWLVHRYLYALLSSQSLSSSSYSSSSSRRQDEPFDDLHTGAEPQQQLHASVVFLSFLRDYAFWRDGCKRLGLDLDVASKKGSFVFVDGLTELFVPPLLERGLGRERALRAATTENLRRVLEDAVAHAQASRSGTRTVLVIDQIDVLLATAGDVMSGQDLRGTVLGLREKVHSCIVTISADEPLIAAQGTPLEKEHASLTLSLAHDAHLIMSLRILETGTAKDVSGVLRVTPGGDQEIAGTPVEDRELLYFIGGDGSVRVFERGQ
ncbi:hypothetical protein F5Y07DRAFT_139647 [Xylaria sp. FL0933]|nr:hypothetical protein F5Y07DRAFT_139647 [Xylaria sp. FL0933]